MKTRLPLAYQILVFQAAILLLSALMGAAAALWQASQELDRQYEQRSLAIAESVASNTAIQDALLNDDSGGLIQKTAEQVRKALEELRDGNLVAAAPDHHSAGTR